MPNKISFVEGALEKVKSRKDLFIILAKCKKKLANYDLTDVDVSNINFKGFLIEDVVFGVFDAKKKRRKRIFNVNFNGCRMNRVSFAQCKLNRCNFEHITEMNYCDFFFSELMNCRFKNTTMEFVDFRYSSLTDCSMGYLNVSYGDFYMTAFCGTTHFNQAKFALCSMTNATFENHCLLMENIDSLIQESYGSYREFMHQKKWYKKNPCGGLSTSNEAEEKNYELGSRIFIAQEAKYFYTIMSGIYGGNGFFRDSNMAYAKARKSEALYYKLQMKKDWEERNFKRWFKDFKGWFNQVMVRCFGYGFKVVPVVCIFFLFVFLFWIFMLVFNHMEPWYKSLMDSACNIFGLDNKNILSSIEKVVGVILIGFLGFVIANKARNNS